MKALHDLFSHLNYTPPTTLGGKEDPAHCRSQARLGRLKAGHSSFL